MVLARPGRGNRYRWARGFGRENFIKDTSRPAQSKGAGLPGTGHSEGDGAGGWVLCGARAGASVQCWARRGFSDAGKGAVFFRCRAGGHGAFRCRAGFPASSHGLLRRRSGRRLFRCRAGARSEAGQVRLPCGERQKARASRAGWRQGGWRGGRGTAGRASLKRFATCLNYGECIAKCPQMGISAWNWLNFYGYGFRMSGNLLHLLP